MATTVPRNGIDRFKWQRPFWEMASTVSNGNDPLRKGNLRRWRERKFRTDTQFEINDFTDKELRARYRFRRASILFIANLVAGDINRNNQWNHALLPLHQVLIALWFCSSEGFLHVIGDTTVSRTITDVSRTLTAKQPCFIKWPLTHDECEKIKNEFYIRGGFPGVVGCVDGTHMRL